MVQNVKQNNGFTLIELLVSIFIFTVVLLGLVASMITVKKINLRNNVRNIAVEQTNNEIEKLRSYGFAQIDNIISKCEGIECSPLNDNCSIKVQYRNSMFSLGKSYALNNVSSSLKKINITTCWNLFGRKYTYTSDTYISKDMQ
ncbi:type IV pilus modification PilV family protein [Deferribacter abyssi]|uniref:type IV pilus modification PilV family protein n=1 Tax=Deferribacter abyssi TaxID=213806 RepID=UPI003C1EFF3D